MTESNHVTPPPAAPPPAQPIPPLRKPWPVGERERRLLPLALALALLCVSALIDWVDWLGYHWMSLPGLGVAVLTAGWYAVLFLYRGTGGMEKRVNRILMGAVILQALAFAIFSNPWFRFWNCGALILLIAVHTLELCGGTCLPWHKAGMLAERLWLMIKGPFVRCGALLDTGAVLKNTRSLDRSLPALIGVAVTLPALWLVASVLMDADAFFALVAGNALSSVGRRFGQLFLRMVLAVCVLPFLFSLLYFAAHPQPDGRKAWSWTKRSSLPAIMLLGALDALYLFFLAVQSAALFGGREYLAQAGISFAEYARSGFFQLVGLAGLNLAVILAALWLCQRDRRLCVLSTALVALTAVLLVSAAWRMTLYVSAYGLSFKRLLTYWGMGMLAVLLALTVRKIWREEFGFFRAAAPAVLAGWLLLNYCNIDAIAVRYNSAQVAAGRLPSSAVEDLFVNFSYDGLGFIEDSGQWLRSAAAEDCKNWTTWSVSAWLAAK